MQEPTKRHQLPKEDQIQAQEHSEIMIKHAQTEHQLAEQLRQQGLIDEPLAELLHQRSEEMQAHAEAGKRLAEQSMASENFEASELMEEATLKHVKAAKAHVDANKEYLKRTREFLKRSREQLEASQKYLQQDQDGL